MPGRHRLAIARAKAKGRVQVVAQETLPPKNDEATAMSVEEEEFEEDSVDSGEDASAPDESIFERALEETVFRVEFCSFSGRVKKQKMEILIKSTIDKAQECSNLMQSIESRQMCSKELRETVQRSTKLMNEFTRLKEALGWARECYNTNGLREKSKRDIEKIEQFNRYMNCQRARSMGHPCPYHNH